MNINIISFFAAALTLIAPVPTTVICPLHAKIGLVHLSSGRTGTLILDRTSVNLDTDSGWGPRWWCDFDAHWNMSANPLVNVHYLSGSPTSTDGFILDEILENGDFGTSALRIQPAALHAGITADDFFKGPDLHREFDNLNVTDVAFAWDSPGRSMIPAVESQGYAVSEFGNPPAREGGCRTGLPIAAELNPALVHLLVEGKAADIVQSSGAPEWFCSGVPGSYGCHATYDLRSGEIVPYARYGNGVGFERKACPTGTGFGLPQNTRVVADAARNALFLVGPLAEFIARKHPVNCNRRPGSGHDTFCTFPLRQVLPDTAI